MTTNGQPPPPPVPGPGDFAFNMSVAQHVNGKYWVMFEVVVSGGAGRFQWAAPVEAVEQFADQIPAALVKLITEVKRANMGLVTAQPGDLDNIRRKK
jgi:hypothetical protein